MTQYPTDRIWGYIRSVEDDSISDRSNIGPYPIRRRWLDIRYPTDGTDRTFCVRPWPSQPSCGGHPIHNGCCRTRSSVTFRPTLSAVVGLDPTLTPVAAAHRRIATQRAVGMIIFW